MESAIESIWTDFSVVFAVFAIVLVKIFLFLWFRSTKNNK